MEPVEALALVSGRVDEELRVSFARKQFWNGLEDWSQRNSIVQNFEKG